MSYVAHRAQGMVQRAKKELAENAISQTLNLLGHSSDEQRHLFISALHRIAHTEQQHLIADWLDRWLSTGPGSLFLTRLLQQLHPNVRKKYLARSVVNLFFRDDKQWANLRQQLGSNPPAALLISPLMRCNYRCQGCYAASYDRDQDMPPELFDKALTEAKTIGTRFISVVGGEPFLYHPLWDAFKKHSDCAFQVYTNGSLITEEAAARIVELGNVAPVISIEGLREETDARRGKGAFVRCLRAMDYLKARGALMGFSATVNRDNVEALTSDEFIDLLIEKGVIYGWYFLSMPVSSPGDIHYMPTPEQRNRMREATKRLRNTKPILLADFWGDSPLTGGCIAGGRLYCHINHKGDVEPCIFAHFSTSNIRDQTFLEALKAPFLMTWRRLQPFSYNSLRPCPIIDHPQVLRSLVQRFGARPTHEGAEHIIHSLCQQLDSYSQGVDHIYQGLWEQKEYTSWARHWMKIMDFPEERIQAREAGYSASQEGEPKESVASGSEKKA